MDASMETPIKKAEILIEALPYIQKLYGKTVVIKSKVRIARPAHGRSLT
jgi:hypothetical protein